ncbi:MAG: aminoacyl-histidine dipeptidase [Defluviitaleaceae bacterium]|nr:aminoacyl-histidine dipeptidase [Defluviitaleaceae bacterium]
MPKKPIEHFKDICAIPHGSYNEKELSDYIVKFAKDLNLDVRQDEKFNVVVKKPGTPGYENAPVVMLQGHIDMVCEKNEGTEHDFLKDGIKVIIEGDIMRADKTTLGADNGTAVAMMMSILESKDIPHPPIEAVFTSLEEVGLLGAAAMSTDDLKSSILINLDGGTESEFCASCAGGIRADLTLPITRNAVSGIEYYELKIAGLKGGHSGMNIHEERGNSNILLCRSINSLLAKLDVYVSQITGGDKDNAIPRESSAAIAVKPESVQKLKDAVDALDKTYKTEYRVSDPDVSITLNKIGEGKDVFCKQSAEKVVSAVLALPCGVIAKSMDIEGLTETSNNVGVLRTNDDHVKVACFMRSASSSRRDFAFDMVKAVSILAGGTVEILSSHAPWEFDPNSKIRKLAIETYEELFGPAKMSATHGGLECGVFIDKMGDSLDSIAFGPSMFDVHTPEERLSISSFERTWELLQAMLKKIN